MESLHIEIQSQPEADFGERMFVYYCRLFDRYNRNVASFAILGDDRPSWRPDRFHRELWGTEIGFRFATAKLLDYAADEAALESDSNPFAVVVLAHLKTLATAQDDEARRVAQVRLAKGLYERGFSGEQIRQLYRLMEMMMTLPKPLAEMAWNEIREFEKEKGMTFITTPERVGREAGLAEGLERGRQEGRQEAARESLLAGIEVALELKFATPDAGLLSEIQQIDDVGLLRKILEAVKRAARPEELRQLWLHSPPAGN